MADDDLDRLDRLLATQEGTLKRAFMRYLKLVHSKAIVAEVTELVEDGKVEAALALLETYIVQFGDTIPSIWQTVGQETADELGRLVPEIAVAISFNITHYRAAELVRQNRVRLIREFSRSQRHAVRVALNRAMLNGWGPAETARAFRGAIGLAAVQEQAVANYRRLLETNDSSVLDRALRDQRFDQTVIRAIERERPLTQRQIGRMVERYRARFLAMRAENIARTEALRAFSEAREEALHQMIEQTGLKRDQVHRIWRSTRDERVRDWHATMQMQERLPGEAFQDGKGNSLMWPGDPNAPAETTINCRCTVTYRVDQQQAA